MDFLRDQGRPPDIRNIDLIQAMFSKSEHETECVLILETFVDQVDKETVLKNKDLPVNTVVGVLRNKVASMQSSPVPQVQIPLP